MIDTDRLRAMLRDVAREVLNEPEPPGVTVVCHYAAADNHDDGPPPEMFAAAARGRRIGVTFCIPDNGRWRGEPRRLPWFSVSAPDGDSWEWSPPDAKPRAVAS